MDFQEMRWKSVDFTDLAQYRQKWGGALLNMEIYLRRPQIAGKYLTGYFYLSKRTLHHDVIQLN
jgi:hypothetical protein